MDGDVSKGVLTAEKFQELLRAKKIDLPTVTEEEINDRSKGDSLSATLTIAQTTWFIIQFVLRLRQSLVITPIEMITLSIAVFNAGLYFCWWQKPLNVRFPLSITLRPDVPTPVQDAGEVDICEMPISVEFMGHYQLQHLITGRIWVSLPAIKLNAFTHKKAATVDFLDEPDRAQHGSENKGKLVLISTWLGTY